MKAPLVLTSETFSEKVKAKLKTFVDIDHNGCWLWTRCRNEYGYGLIRIGSYESWCIYLSVQRRTILTTCAQRGESAGQRLFVVNQIVKPS